MRGPTTSLVAIFCRFRPWPITLKFARILPWIFVRRAH